MAKFNEILVGRFNRGLQKLTGIKGEVPSPQLASEIMPVLPMFYGVENRYLESWDRFAAVLSLSAPGAGNTNAVRVRNAVGSNVMSVIEKIFVSNAIDQFITSLGPTTADLGTAQIARRLDSRGRPQSSLIFTSSQIGAQTTLTGVIWAATFSTTQGGDMIITDDQEIALLPGDAIQIQNNAPNTTGAFHLWWRERFLEESERT